MSVRIDEVLDYLDEHLICSKAETMPSLMKMLHDAYIEHNSIDSETLRSLFCRFRAALEPLPNGSRDLLYSQVCDLCMEHEQLAFSQGVLTGMLLMTEVNRLP